MLKVRVLGAAAGGGFPQWNSNGPNCRRARAGDPATPIATQASLAVGDGSGDWAVLDASPDIGRQILANPILHPRRALRDSPIAAVVLTGADVDKIAGLLTLRERQAFALYGTARVLATLDANPIFEVLNRDLVARHAVALDQPFRPAGLALRITPFAVPGKVPLYLEGREDELNLAEVGENAIGLMVEDGTRRLAYVPGCAVVTDAVRQRLAGVDALFLDGTLWSDDEMVAAGLGPKTGRRMGHVSMSGPEGAIARLADVACSQRFFIHINNSNPVLDRYSPQRQALEQAGWRVAEDGMELNL
ncbi:pyrroloquinoline quinone biosynthesis protein PqqB [Zavarzinia sp. CC-PAN008]|uniref:pyrroloquinoline quinone biosynthesis protein PqqB n=1 Tax=Zavarzinia sp. CC-PAN008 TaxID=3243332 RepID=UPI003F74448E